MPRHSCRANPLSLATERLKMAYLNSKTWALAFAALIAGTGITQAQPNCAQRAIVLERLAQKYGETRRGMGLGANNGLVEVFASNETGTWTITVTLPDGRTCLVASGNSYEDGMDPLKAKGTAL